MGPGSSSAGVSTRRGQPATRRRKHALRAMYVCLRTSTQRDKTTALRATQAKLVPISARRSCALPCAGWTRRDNNHWFEEPPSGGHRTLVRCMPQMMSSQVDCQSKAAHTTLLAGTGWGMHGNFLFSKTEKHLRVKLQLIHLLQCRGHVISYAQCCAALRQLLVTECCCLTAASTAGAS